MKRYLLIVLSFVLLFSHNLFSDDSCNGVGVDELLPILNGFKTCGNFKKYTNNHPCVDIRGVIEGIKNIVTCKYDESSFSEYEADKINCVLIIKTKEFGGLVARVDATRRVFEPSYVGPIMEAMVGQERFKTGSELLFTHGKNLCDRSE